LSTTVHTPLQLYPQDQDQDQAWEQLFLPLLPMSPYLLVKLLNATVLLPEPQDLVSPHQDQLHTTPMEALLLFPKEVKSQLSLTLHLPHNAKLNAVLAQLDPAHLLLPQPEPDIGILLEESVFLKPSFMLAMETILNHLLDIPKNKKPVLTLMPMETSPPPVDNASLSAIECKHLIITIYTLTLIQFTNTLFLNFLTVKYQSIYYLYLILN